MDAFSSFYLCVCIYTANYFGVTLDNPSIQALHSDPSLNTFLDSGNCQLLGAHMVSGETEITLSTKVGGLFDLPVHFLEKQQQKHP